MPVRTRITLLFTLIVFVILSIVCCSVYYVSYNNRVKSSRSRLTNFAVTTGRLLNSSASYGYELIRKRDSSNTLSVINKSVQVYDDHNNRIYAYNDKPEDSLTFDPAILKAAKDNGTKYFTIEEREVVAYRFTSNSFDAIIVVGAFDKEGKGNLRQLGFVLWGSFLAGIFIAFAGGYWFSKSLLKPVRKIADEVHEISAQNLARRIQAGSGKDEWSYLSGTLNELLNRLQESFEIQARFIANASHELSTPLSSISSQLEVSLLRSRDAGDYRKVMQSVYQDVLQLNKLTQTLLEFAKASGTTSGLEISLVRSDEILLMIKSDLIKLDKNYTVLLDFADLPEEEEELLVLGNEALLLTAIKNIVINACKYSENKLARIKLSVRQDKIIIDVADDGSGIAEAELKNIFQPFYRAGYDFSVKGSGLGLSLAYRIINLHKGAIEVTSIVNKGSTFTIQLPAAVS